MKKKFLKVLYLVGVLVFAMPAVGHLNNVGYARESMTLEDKNKELFLAVRAGELEKVKELIENGADVNAAGDEIFCRTPLCFASDIEIAKLLIENGADVNANLGGIAPLHWAGAQTAKLLIEHGADVNVRDGYGKTPLYYADAETAKVLIENGADVNAKSFYGHTSLHYIEDVETAKVLIENGADINAKDCGWTPLGFACCTGNLEMAKLLIEKGADINITSHVYGEGTPLEVARNNGHQDIVNLLLEIQ